VRGALAPEALLCRVSREWLTPFAGSAGDIKIGDFGLATFGMIGALVARRRA
jgi:hypothetical protein